MAYTVVQHTDKTLENTLKQLKLLLLAEARGGDIDDAFITQLNEIGYSPNLYLRNARKMAKKHGYDPARLNFAMDNDHKLCYDSSDGLKYFGKAGYGDYLIWKFKEKRGLVADGYSKMKRAVFRASHGEISKIHSLGKNSPNELSINILW